MMVQIPCDEKFIQQYFRNLANSKPLIKSLEFLFKNELQKYNDLIQNNINRDDMVCNFLLLDSFLSREGESEAEFLDRYYKTMFFTAEKGNPISQFAVAEYFEDSGNNSKAFKYYQLSSDKQFVPSLTNTGIKLIYGISCTIDINKGLYLLRKAKKLGDDIAKEFLDCYK